jgi:hypothetical protein
MDEEAARALRAPFPDSMIGKLPATNKRPVLDYVGHAAVTDRLLAVDPTWTWEPCSFNEAGAPLIYFHDNDAVMWIRLTICGVTRPGVGIVAASAFELEKQLISDALRNAAMRFGVALDLWAKENLGATDEPAAAVPYDFDPDLVEEVKATVVSLTDDERAEFTAWKDTQAYPWPWPVEACNEMLREMARILMGRSEASQLPADICPVCRTEISAENPLQGDGCLSCDVY